LQACLGPENRFTVFCGEIYAIILALQIAQDNETLRPITTFTDNRTAIQSIAKGNTKSGQYLLEEIIQLCDDMQKLKEREIERVNALE
jgi:hypothetical protein